MNDLFKLKMLLVFLILNIFVVTSQEENKETIKINEGIFRSSFQFSKELFKRFHFQNTIDVSYDFNYNQIELPFLLRYQMDDKWSLFGGAQLNYFKSRSPYFNVSGFNSSLQVGTRIDFSRNKFGEIKYEYNLSKDYNPSSNFKKGAIKFNFGYKF